MPNTESLDELIAKNAAEFADQIKAAAQMADKEEEIRIEAERQLAFIEKQTGIKLEGKHEFTVASGRADSVYDRVIIEYKNPKSPGARIGPKADSPGSKKVVDQIKNRFYDMRTAHGHQLNTMFGVGLDGNYFIFIRFRDDKWHVQEPVEVNKYSAERFLWALYNLGQKGKPFSSEYLAGDFGADSKLAQDGVRALYNAIIATDNPKAQIFFSQWKILFGEVCGYDVDNPSDKIKKLAEFYGVEHRKKFKAAELLFAVHSYYAIFMKLLASEIAAYFHKLPTPLQKMIQAGSSNALKREMEDLEAGSIFRHLNITNFLEGDLFAWYIPVWSEPIEQLVRGMVARLDDYNPGTLSEDPAGSRDLLKKLYQQLFPKSVRHDLGEYYTPDWLAEHVLNELEYVGDPDKRLLDPACGSGTFLIMAINRIRKWYDENREQARFDEGDLCRKILSNVIGFELNPLAVMAARTNYLIAIRDLVGHVDRVEIPIYLCDSIMTPSEYGGSLFSAGLGKAKELKTAAANFIIPTEIATHRDEVGKYAEQLEFCVRNGYSGKEFLERCRDEGLPVTDEDLHSELYEELVKLDKANKNGVWARIIKNAFAPLFIGQVDYIAGNPPWVNWRNLPADYRAGMAPLWETYGLFTQRGLQARLGAGMDDISVLMTYVAGAVYLSPGGRLGFVITQTLFQSAGGGIGFRRFKLPNGRFFKVLRVHDFSSFQPFEGATNRTATLILANSATPTVYPVEYVKMFLQPEVATTHRPDELALRAVPLEATPIAGDLASSWAVLPKGLSGTLSKVLGKSTYIARIGAHSGGAAGVYWVDIVSKERGLALVANRGEAGRNKYPSITASVEGELVRPLARGRDVDRWQVNPSLHIVMPYDVVNNGKAIAEARLKREFPKTFEYFVRFKSRMIKRPHYLQHFEPSGQPFWSMYNVGNYSFANWRVVWREQSSSFKCAVIEGDQAPVADAKLIVVACSSSNEAHYLAAVLNSSVARYAIESYVVKVQISTHVLKNLRVPTFSSKDAIHRRLAECSKLCHSHAAKDDRESLRLVECEIDTLTASLWQIDKSELEGIQTWVHSDARDG
jgi:hypothetical protein